MKKGIGNYPIPIKFHDSRFLIFLFQTNELTDRQTNICRDDVTVMLVVRVLFIVHLQSGMENFAYFLVALHNAVNKFWN